MANAFDRFDVQGGEPSAQPAGNPFDAFDEQPESQEPVTVEADDSPGLFSNSLRNAGERGFDLLGNFIQFIGNAAEKGEKAITDRLDGFNPGVVIDKSDTLKGKGYEPDLEIGSYGVDFTSRAKPEDTDTGLGAAGQAVEDVGLGYEPNFTIDKALDEPTLRNLAGAVAEQGPAALSDMAALIISTPAYLASRTQEIGEARVENDGGDIRNASPELQKAIVDNFANGTEIPEELQREADQLAENGGMPELKDYLVAGPTAAASVLLDRFALGKLLPGGGKAITSAKQVPGAVGRAFVTEAGTEAVQEGGIEYAGESIGTEAGYDPTTAGRRAAGGALVGGPTGGVVRGGTATYEAATATPESEASTRESVGEGVRMDAEPAQEGIDVTPQDTYGTNPFDQFDQPVEVNVTEPAPGQEPAEPPTVEAAAEQEAATDEPSALTESGTGVFRVPVDQIQVDPEQYQFRSRVNEQGVDKRLEGVKRWDDKRAGTVLLHRREDGSLYVADGHHRVDLARRLDQGEINARVVDEADGISVADARVEAAMNNIADGKAEPIDVAKVFRGSEVPTSEVRDTFNLPSNQAVRDGEALSRLSDNVFGMVTAGQVSEKDGAAIGNAFTEQSQQEAAADAFQKIEPQTDYQRQLLVNELRASEFAQAQGDQGGLFGDDAQEISLMQDRLKVLDTLRQRLNTDRKLFKSLNDNADRASEAGNQIAAEANESITQQSARSLDLIGRVTTTPALNEMVNRAARRVYDGESRAAVVKDLKQELLNYEQGTNEQDSGRLDPAPGRRENAEPGQEPRASEPVPAEDTAETDQGREPEGGQQEEVTPELELEAQTEEQLAEQARTRDEAEQAETEQRRTEEQRVQADEQADSFALTGSDRTADVAMAAGQEDLLSQAAAETDTSPTEGQKEAGNYKKGKVRIQGLEIAIENPKGSVRSGTDPDGNRWESTMAHHYGDIKGTTAADGDNLDVFIGPDPDINQVFVIDQPNADGSFDEHKILLGFKNEKAAKEGYLANYEKGWKVGSITRMSTDELKTWMREGDTTQPLAEAAAGQKVEATAGSRYSFAGQRADTADQYNLFRAKEMLGEGADAESVRKETGWFKGKDEQWRFEIDDSDARYLPAVNGDAGKMWTESLDRVLDHPKLFAAYPGIRDIDVVSVKGMDGSNGSYSQETREITINAEKSTVEQFSTLMHEIQHGIQNIEGFARGGNSNSAAYVVRQSLMDKAAERGDFRLINRYQEALRTYGLYSKAKTIVDFRNITQPRQLFNSSYWYEYSDQIRNVFDAPPKRGPALRQYAEDAGHWIANRLELEGGYDIQRILLNYDLGRSQSVGKNQEGRKNLNNAYRKAERKFFKIDREQLQEAHATQEQIEKLQFVPQSEAYDLYRRLYGEVESRNVQARQGMTEQERQATPPEQTQDVSSDDAIVVMNGTTMNNAPEMANAADFRRNPGQRAESLTATEARSMADGLMKDWKGRPDLTVADSISDFPKFLRDAIRAAGAESDMRAVYLDNHVYILAPRIPNEQALQEVILHETIGHYGLRKMLGGELKPLLNRVYMSMGNTDAANDLKATYFPEGNFDPKNTEHRLTIAEELIAHLAESNQHQKLWNRIKSVIRDGLRRLGFTLELNDTDLLNLLRGAQQTVEQGGFSRPSDADINFSREDQTNTEAFRKWFGDSKVVDESGRPKIVYHGTNAEFSEFDGQFAEREDSFSFTDDIRVANTYRLQQIDPNKAWQAYQDASSEQKAEFESELEQFKGDGASDQEAIAAWAEVANGDNPELWASDFAEAMGVDQNRLYGDAPMGQMVSAYLSLQNPVEYWYDEDGNITETREPGGEVDGYIHHNVMDTNSPTTAQYSSTVYQVLDGSQVKSAIDNSGAFDPDNPDIRFSRGSNLPPNVKFNGPGIPDLDPQPFGPPSDTLVRKLISKIADKHTVLKGVQKNIQDQFGEIPEPANAYRAEELFHGKVENDVRLIEENMVEPLAKSMSENNVSLKQLDEYLYALHAPERNAVIAERNPEMPEGGSGMTDAEAAAVIAKVKKEGKLEQYQALAKRVHDMLAMRRKILKSAGLLDEDTVGAWEASYKNYVPLKGWAADEQQPSMPRIGKGFAIAGKESQMAAGRTSKAASPVANSISDLSEAVLRRRKNEVGQSFMNLVQAYPNDNYWRIYTDEDPKVERKAVRVKDPATGKMKVEVREQTIPMAMMSDRYFTTKVNGKTHYIRIEDQRLMNAMRNIGPDNSNLLIRSLAAVTRIMSSLNTSYNPEFVISNFSRDIQTALLNLTSEQSSEDGKARGKKIAAKTLKNVGTSIRAINASLKGKKLTGKAGEWQAHFDQFRADGAKTGWFDMKDIDGQMKDLEKMIAVAGGGPVNTVRRAFKATTDWVENTNSAIENGVRLSAYVNAIEAGIPRSQAASLAKNMTVNFNRKGELGTMMNALYMFANASVQGTANFVRTLGRLNGVKGDPTWQRMHTAQKIAVGMAVGGFALSMLNRMVAGEDDDEVNWWDKVPDYIKERNIVIMKSLVGGEPGEYWTIPLPYGYNIFPVIGTQMEHIAFSESQSAGDAASNVALAALGSFSPIGFEQSEELYGILAKNIMPTILRPVASISLNENFMGGPIYKENFPFGTQKPDSALYFRSTPEAFKALAEGLNEATGGSEFRSGAVDLSPDVMQFLVGYYGGGAYDFFTSRTPNYVAKVLTGVEREDREVPFWRKIHGKVLPYEDQSKFYDRRNEINQLVDERKALKGRERIEFMKDYREKLRLQGIMKSTEDRLKKLREQRDRIELMDLSAAEEDEKLQRVEKQMKRAIDQFNKRYNEAED